MLHAGIIPISEDSGYMFVLAGTVLTQEALSISDVQVESQNSGDFA
jgi:hypothetical protein